MSSLLSICVAHMMMQAFAMNTTVGFFVEMVSQIQKSLLKFSPGYIWLILGWVITWHILLGGEESTSSFHGLRRVIFTGYLAKLLVLEKVFV